MAASVLVMAKAPLPGHVKTRLSPPFSPEQCALLQERLIARTAAWAVDVAPGAVRVAFDPPRAREQMERILPADVELVEQEAGDLGARLAAAVAGVGEAGFPLLVVGVDTRLTRAHAERALAELADGADAVFGPALDGGYYLAALRRAEPRVFALPAGTWGGPDVLARSLGAARAAGLSTALIDAERDLDTPEDAAHMRDDPEIGDVVRAALGP